MPRMPEHTDENAKNKDWQLPVKLEHAAPKDYLAPMTPEKTPKKHPHPAKGNPPA